MLDLLLLSAVILDYFMVKDGIPIERRLLLMSQHDHLVLITPQVAAGTAHWNHWWTKLSSRYRSMGQENSCKIIWYHNYFENNSYFPTFCSTLYTICVMIIWRWCGNCLSLLIYISPEAFGLLSYFHPLFFHNCDEPLYMRSCTTHWVPVPSLVRLYTMTVRVSEVAHELVKKLTNKVGFTAVAFNHTRKNSYFFRGLEVVTNNTASTDGWVGVTGVTYCVGCLQSSWWATEYNPMPGEINCEHLFTGESR